MSIDDTSTMNGDEEPETNRKKKFRKFSGKELRTQIQGDQKLIALQNFLQQIKENTSQDCALEYLQKHGNIHEILQCMEQDSTIPPVLILEIVNELLLKIISSKIDCKDATLESCRYLLKNFITTINKMIGLASSSKERIVTIRLLTTIATFSSALSKDILMQVNFNLTNLELISKNTLENKTVRKHFVYFLTALLIDIEYPTLSLLLEKKGMLTSIIPGLQYDDVDTVCFMLTAMKNNILENQFVSKTVKMKTFNTIVIKSIVNLYNWKGPTNLKASKKAGAAPVEVDELQKAKVNECVHDFLLILCTSHKFGVVFRDSTVGMGKKTQNALIYTVLDSMDSPWDHSYASDLVIKICSACPDLTKYVWNILKTPSEPRNSVKWNNVVNFIRRLLEEIKPNCLEPYAKQLNLHQICQIIPILVAPLPILKVILPENVVFENQIIKLKVISIICSMIKSIQSFIEAFQNWLDNEKFSKLENHLANYIERNFPTGQTLLENWNDKDKENEELKDFNPLNYLSVVFDIFENYMKLCPELLDSLKFSHSDLKVLLETMDNLNEELPDKERNNLQVKIIDLFLDANSGVFSLKSESFSFFLSFLIKICYENINNDDFSKCFSVLTKFLKSTKIFDYGSEREVNVWINGIFGIKSLKENISGFLTEAIKLTSSKTVEYLMKMSQIYQKIQNENGHTEKSSSSNLSPLLMGVLECLNGREVERSTISYLNYAIPNLIFLQSDHAMITEILRGNQSNHAFSNYAESLFGGEVSFEISKVLKVFGKHDLFNEFNQALASENFFEFLINFGENYSYPDMKLDLLYMGIFYFSRLLELDHAQQNLYGRNLMTYIKFLLETETFDVKIVLNNSSFITYFSILKFNDDGDFNTCTNFIVDFIKIYSEKRHIMQGELQLFLDKIQGMLCKILGNPKKYTNVQVLKILEIFRMNSQSYVDIIAEISNHVSDKPLKCKYQVFCIILVHCLEEFCKLSDGSLTADVCRNLMNFYIFLNDATDFDCSNLSKAILSMFSTFPQYIDYVDESFVNSILNCKEYDKTNADLLILILRKRKDLLNCINENLNNVVNVKGILYPVLQMLSQRYHSDDGKIEIVDIFKQVFDKFEDSLHKIIKKPQKASQHLDNNFQGVLLLTDLHFQKDKFEEYVSKIQKFEVTKIFHVNLLYTIFKNFIQKDADEKIVCNTTLTFVHLLLNILKKSQKTDDSTTEIVDTVCDCFMKHLGNIEACGLNSKLQNVHNNESFKHMIKFCLKYGVVEYEKLLQILDFLILATHDKFNDDFIKSIMDMLVSHSEFLDVVLSEHKCKKDILSLMLSVCENWPKVMDRSHVPVLLSAYGATLSKTDRIILELLKLYESERIQTSFSDFKPYLWGNAGANHYSVRLGIEKALLKQPKMNDVMNLLQENIVISTIKNYNLFNSKNCPNNLDTNSIYDLEFLLPLFSHLLAPENVVKTYHFTQSGALSLSIIALSSNKREIREAACHVLARFHFHVEAKQGGKDNLLWIRLIEAICRGISDENYNLNNFASIFLAKSALILTQPNHVMYLPISQFLAAKSTLNLSSIPELYTFLHSSDVNYKEHRNFILEIMSEGLICEDDYNIFFRSMALKLITELYSSCTCDNETKLLILDVLIAICRVNLGAKFVCIHNSIIEYLIMDLEGYANGTNRVNVGIICRFAKIFDNISSNFDISEWNKYLMSNASKLLMNSEVTHFLPSSASETLLKISKLSGNY